MTEQVIQTPSGPVPVEPVVDTIPPVYPLEPVSLDTRDFRMNAANRKRKAEKLVKVVNKQQEWRVGVWASAQMKIAKAQADLIALGEPPVALEEPDFSKEENLLFYAAAAGFERRGS